MQSSWSGMHTEKQIPLQIYNLNEILHHSIAASKGLNFTSWMGGLPTLMCGLNLSMRKDEGTAICTS